MSQSSHLDDPRLSALVDGEATAGDLEHTAGCTECAARVAAWQEIRRLVAAAPEAPPAVEREAAIVAALAEAERPAPPVVPPEVSPMVSPVVPPVSPVVSPDVSPVVPPVSPASPAVSLSERLARRARWARASLGVAAVLVIVGVVTAAVHAGGPGSHSSAKSSSAASGSSARQPSAPAATTPTPAPQPVAHLGTVEGPDPLVAVLRSALARPPASTSSPPGGAAAASDAAVTACLDPATTDAHLPEGSNPSLEASLTYEGTPAGTFVFDSGSQHVAVVLAQAGCRLLADLTF